MDPTGTKRWWDGSRWTTRTQESAPPAPPTPRGPAPVVLRVLARIADAVIIGPLLGLASFVWLPIAYDADALADFDIGIRDTTLTETLSSGDSPALVLLAGILLALLWELYWLMSEGASPGKQLLGLYVVDPSSEIGRVEPFTAFKRTIHRVIEIVPFGVFALAALSAGSLILMFQDRAKRQSVMDRFAGTTVHRLPPGSPRLTPWLQVWIVTAIGLFVILLVTEFLDLR